jgi:hypothetical protein
MQSAVLQNLNEINRELELARHGRIDPARRRYLELRKAGLLRDAAALSFTDEERKTGDINYGKTADAESKSVLAPHHSWMKDEKPKTDGDDNWNRVTQARLEAQGRYDAIYAKDKKL